MIVGLTGGIGSGKTSASNQFMALGIPVIDSDVIAREVVLPGMPALSAISEHFGTAILQDDGQLNRAALRQKIFQDNHEKQWLESLLHPLIRERTINQLTEASKGKPYIILSSPLLLETDQHTLCDVIVIVDLLEQQQVERATRRDKNSTEQIKRIIAAQISREERLTRADYILDNSGSYEQLIEQVNNLDTLLRSKHLS
ncbi:dephospho-CoA kinase [Neptunomonas phycophila]|uniref:dephospho-CoA kinase n=1 Tax=Neptunomonas phycophila TaxID=1572645 RepID=UPI00094917DC|nr:dephospho-CoA kinase [Neptunomonas phycophila]